ncbi:DUF4174 domain-containing protein [Mucilaginibacter psychrotolerans]|uniref:DUF4174 domain-containing protein n=1 Tax=Mucilaginibacter psychrotolerans TaxID=1524096 RepID=A0A4Y8RYH0_9SPHI|nr:DUF4174 domain-containing protein [Mucilaginibacter psychrotolerans]TFF30450.1 DUF4174 domain-containing protein [Mucilaginibacter psychrotolerans]
MHFLIFVMMLLPVGQQSNKRVLTIYAQSDNEPQYKQQIQLFDQDKAGLLERDVVVRTIFYNDANANDFRKAQVKDNFTIVLTGKDGGEKYRSNKLLPLQKLYAIIDVMPMRKAEMRKN